MKRIIPIVLAAALLSSCGNNGSGDSQEYVDSTDVTPNSTVNPGGPTDGTNFGEGAGVDTTMPDKPGTRTTLGKDSASDTLR